ncbi:hypothetical protein ACLB2K_053553 [Fragaria x ananassa]
MGLLVSKADVDDASVVPVVAPIVEVVSDGIKGGLMSKGGAPGGTLPGGKGSKLVRDMSRQIEILREEGKLLEMEKAWFQISDAVSSPNPGTLNLSSFRGLFLVTGEAVMGVGGGGGGSDWVEEVSVLVGWGGGGGSDEVALTVVVGWRIGARRQRSGGDREIEQNRDKVL